MKSDAVKRFTNCLLLATCALSWLVAGTHFFHDHSRWNQFLKRTELLPITFPAAEALSVAARESEVPFIVGVLLLSFGSFGLIRKSTRTRLVSVREIANCVAMTSLAFAIPATYIVTMWLASRAMDGC